MLLWVLATLLSLLLLVVLALLFLPLDVAGRADPTLVDDDWEGDWSGTVTWAATLRFGGPLLRLSAAGEGLHGPALQVWILGLRLKSRPRKPPKAKPREPQPERKRRERDPELGWALFMEGWKAANRLWRDLAWRLPGDLTYGLPDPALTGMCEALLWSLGRPPGLVLRPNFVQPCLTGWVETQGRIYGVQMASAIWTACTHPVIRDRIKKRIRLRLWRTRTA